MTRACSAIGGDNHDGADFAGTKEGTPVLETGQEDGDDREDEDFCRRVDR